MMGSFAFRDETFVTFNDGNGRVFDFPFADIAEGLATNGSLLGSFRRSPTF